MKPFDLVGIKIEKNIPLKPKDRFRGKEKSPFRQALERMEVGDSMLLPVTSRGQRQRYAATCSEVKKVSGLQFAIRKIEGDSIRVWRVN